MSEPQKSLKELLTDKKANICAHWQDAVLSTYPAESVAVFRKQKNHVTNPIGYRVTKCTEGLFDELLGEMDQERIYGLLDDLISVRAVQEFTPSQALAFVLQLKTVIRDGLKPDADADGPALGNEMRTLERSIDALALSAFDVFMKCRERLWSVKYNDLRNSTHVLLKKSGMLSSFPPM